MSLANRATKCQLKNHSCYILPLSPETLATTDVQISLTSQRRASSPRRVAIFLPHQQEHCCSLTDSSAYLLCHFHRSCSHSFNCGSTGRSVVSVHAHQTIIGGTGGVRSFVETTLPMPRNTVWSENGPQPDKAGRVRAFRRMFSSCAEWNKRVSLSM